MLPQRLPCPPGPACQLVARALRLPPNLVWPNLTGPPLRSPRSVRGGPPSCRGCAVPGAQKCATLIARWQRATTLSTGSLRVRGATSWTQHPWAGADQEHRRQPALVADIRAVHDCAIPGSELLSALPPAAAERHRLVLAAGQDVRSPAHRPAHVLAQALLDESRFSRCVARECPPGNA